MRSEGWKEEEADVEDHCAGNRERLVVSGSHCVRFAPLALILTACARHAAPPVAPKHREPPWPSVMWNASDPAVAPAASAEVSPRDRSIVLDLGLDVHPSRPPSWLEPKSGRPSSLALDTDIPTLGAHHAIHHTDFGTFLTSNRREPLGPLPFPDDVAFSGFDEHDGIYLATSRGALLRIAHPEDAIDPNKVERVASIPDVVRWDAAGRFVIAGVTGAGMARPSELEVAHLGGRETAIVGLLVSSDHGAHFTRRRLPGMSAEQIFVRPDGALFATVGEPSLASQRLEVAEPGDLQSFLSSDLGATWAPIELAAANGPITRLGGAIVGTNPEGQSVAIDDKGKLVLFTPPCTDRWSEQLRLDEVSEPQPEGCFEVDPRAPNNGARALLCSCPPQRGGCVVMGSRSHHDGFLPDTRQSIPSTRTTFGLVGSTLCEQKDHDVEPPAPPGTQWGYVGGGEPETRCRPGAKLVNHVSIAIRDAGLRTLKIVAPPEGLTPSALLNAGGIALALFPISDSESRLFVVDAHGAFHEEARVPFTEGVVFRAEADGTLVLTGGAGGGSEPRRGAHAFLRRPVEVGARDAWRDISVTDAAMYLVVAGGRALVASDPTKDHSTLRLVDDTPTGRRQLGHVDVKRDDFGAEIVFVDDHLFLDPALGGGWLAIRADGTFEHTGSCLIWGRCDAD